MVRITPLFVIEYGSFFSGELFCIKATHTLLSTFHSWASTEYLDFNCHAIVTYYSTKVGKWIEKLVAKDRVLIFLGYIGQMNGNKL